MMNAVHRTMHAVRMIAVARWLAAAAFGADSTPGGAVGIGIGRGAG
jgi:hypothetical protein